MKCAICSQTVNEEDKFCGNCGNAILFVQTDGEKKSLAIASSGQRLVNYFLDQIFITIGALIVGSIAGIIIALTDASLTKNSSFMLGFSFGASISVTVLYYSIFESVTGKTIGKYITKTKVVKKNGDKIKLRHAIIRSICRCIPFDVFSFLGNNPIGWHDSISKTIVIKENKS